MDAFWSVILGIFAVMLFLAYPWVFVWVAAGLFIAFVLILAR